MRKEIGSALLGVLIYFTFSVFIELLRGKMKSVIIAYIFFMTVYLIFQMIVILKFIHDNKKRNAIMLLDHPYLIAMIVFHVLSFTLLYDRAFTVYHDIVYFETHSFPYVIRSLPVIIIISAIMINEGLFSYTSDRVFSSKNNFRISDIQIGSMKETKPFRRAKVTLLLVNDSKKRMTVRTSSAKANAFYVYLNN